MKINFTSRSFTIATTLILFFISNVVKASSDTDWYTYTDEATGFSLELPEAPNYTDDYDAFIMYSYNAPNSNRIYSFFSLDFRGLNKDNAPDDIMDSFITNIVTNLNGELLNKKRQRYAEGLRYKVSVKLNAKKLMNAQFTLQNNILYYQSVEDDTNEIEDAHTDHFFESITIGAPKPKKEIPWIDYKSPEGAFSIKLPGEPVDLSRAHPNPIDENGEPYYLHMYNVQDLKNDNNYLFRYNDQPLGYYMEDPVGAFESIKDNFEGKASLVGEGKTIYLDGYEGREYELLIQDQYHSVCRIYIRGNRTYLLLKQKLNPTDKASTDDVFFNSFTFEAPKPLELETLSPKGTNFEIQFLEDNKLTIDSLGYENVYLKNSHDYFALNKESGDVYQFGYSDIKDYFKIKSRKEFFETNVNSLLVWNDSILSQKDITINNKEALEFYIQNKRTKVTTRHQIWLENKRLFLLTGYLSKEGMDSELSNRIFSSYKETSKGPEFDMFSSKTDLLLEHLKSTDTIVFKNALGAFDYYVFEPEDLPKLYKAMTDNYASSETKVKVSNEILEELTITNDSNTLEFLKTLYLNPNTNDTVKAHILNTISELPSNNRLTVFNTLLNTSIPTNSENYTYGVTAPYRDSLEFAIDNSKILLNLNNYEAYRSDVLDIFNDIAENHPEHLNLVSDNLDTLLKYSESDLKKYLEMKEGEDYNYKTTSLMYSYLSLYNTMPYNNPSTDAFTKALINVQDNEWLSLRALTARIHCGLNVDSNYTSKKLDSLFSRYEIMEVYHKTNQFDKVPKKYTKPESFAQLVLYNYLGEEEGYPDNLDVLGKVSKDDAIFYAISYSYEDEEDDSEYIGLVGPVTPISKDKPFTKYKSYSGYEPLQKDWKNQALDLIPDLLEYGY
ncbi:hypothetical protein [Mangrovimonas sp. TPBH4]|uniref:hypothetical protein n=1 Tax=Mangrovimonas sp. TPBH4 TaxID=1645914 RepID=UPI0006B455E2|nr:hypothetical protein [Mangrovimonas sp. TPBH4]